MIPVALEVDDGIYHVFQNAGPRDLAVLGDMPDEHGNAARVLGEDHQVQGTFPKLGHGARRAGKVLLVDRLIMGNPAVTLSVAAAVSVALAATIIVAKIIGSTLPLLAKRLGFDPAVMASPFITTIVDAIGLIVYYLISANVFGLVV